jgi:hypothetical protein
MTGLNPDMIGGSYKFSDLLKDAKKKKKKKTKKRNDPSQIGYPSEKSNLNIIIRGPDGNLYKNKRYKKTKKWHKVSTKVRAGVRPKANPKKKKKKKNKKKK